MFTSKSVRPVAVTLEGLRKLPHNLKKKEHFIIEAIYKNNHLDIRKVIEYLESVNPATLFMLSENSHTIKLFCGENPELMAQWQKRLRDKGEMACKIIPRCGENSVSSFALWLGSFLMDQYEDMKKAGDETNAMDFLNAACDMGYYYAIRKRLSLNMDALFSSSDEEKSLGLDDGSSQIMRLMMDDCQKIGDLYWSVGYIRAGGRLLDMALWLAENTSEKLMIERIKSSGVLPELGAGSYPHCLAAFEAAIEAYCFSWLLKDNPTSLEITQGLLGEKPLSSICSKYDDDWESFHKRLAEIARDDFGIPSPEEWIGGVMERAADKINADEKSALSAYRRALL